MKALLPLWPWLPAFRAVAETEHLPSAARLVDSTPSSLSRAIAQLERHLGRAVFARDGRTLRLNEQGHQLLDAVREAMRRCDEGLRAVDEPMLHGPLAIASLGAGTTAFVAPALQRLLAAHPRLVPGLTTPAPDQIRPALRSGRLDIAFLESAIEARDLVTVQVGSLRRSIWCGPSHPLFPVERPSEKDLDEAGFLAPPDDERGLASDGWPAPRRRRIAVTVDQLRVAIELCRRLPLLAVLPDVLAAEQGQHLRRLPFDFVPPTEVFAIHRRALAGRRGPVEALLAEL